MAVLLILLLCSRGQPAEAQSVRPAPSPGLDSLVPTIAAFYPRQEGSPAEGALLDWIAARATGDGGTVQPFDFSHSDFEHSFARNLRVDVRGRSRDTLILAVPIDSRPGAGPSVDGSAGVALAVDLLDRLKGQAPARSLVVLFLGAEFGDSDSYPMGSALFLHDFPPDFPASVLYLDIAAAPSRVLVRGSGRRVVTPYAMMKQCIDALEGAQVPYRLEADEAQAFRLGVTDERTPVEPWLRAGFPAIGLEDDERAPVAGAADRLPALAAFLDRFLSEGAGGTGTDWDKHYLLVQVAGRTLLLGETQYVAAFGGTLAALLLFALGRLRRLKKYTRILVRNSAAIVPLAALAFAFLVAGTWAVAAIPVLRGFPEVWKYAPLPFLGLKICVALFLCAALYPPLRYLPFPRNGSFYSAAALLFLLLEIGVVAVFDVSFTPYFLWAFLFLFLSSLARNRWWKLLAALPAPVWALRGIVTIFQLPALPLSHVLTLSPLLGNLIVAGAFLPFIFVVLRLALLFPGRGPMTRGVREVLLAGVLLVAAGALAVRLLTFSPFSVARPQPLVATQTVMVDSAGRTESTTLGIESPAPLRGVFLSTPGEPRPVPVRRESRPIPLAPVPSPLDVSVESGQFLQQLNLTLGIRMPSRPRLLTLSIDAARDFVLYDSSFPAVREGPRSYRLLVGAFPPDPLSVQLTLPTGKSFTITLTAEFDSPLIGAEVIGPPDTRVATRIRVVRRLEVK
ncbi:MAG TPA: hypothetical protein VFI08_08240, partial [Spirochaetia bacterium]|nr:hypothetical protein [Spirochaetia bacterium]